jgi:serine phosphatase RsbU (regulator of sigma subunit)
MMTIEIHDNTVQPELCCLEIENFVRTVRLIRPPNPGIRIGQVEVYGDSVFLNGAAGGDHIIYVEFERRYDLERRIRAALEEGNKKIAARLGENRGRLGILVGDVSGHQTTDALAAAMLHQAFLTGVLYELDRYGEVTTKLFENLNTRFFNSLSFKKYITLIYGEISSTGMSRFLSAGGPPPLVFSAEYDRFVTLSPDRLVSFAPLGIMPSEDDVDISKNLGPLGYKPSYTVNEVNLLGIGDILVLYTDGLSEHADEGERMFVPDELEATIRRTKGRTAHDIYEAVRDRALSFAPLTDDVTVVVIKKTQRSA